MKSELMSEPLLNNSVAKQDFLHIQIPVQVEVLELRGAIMQQMGKNEEQHNTL